MFNKFFIIILFSSSTLYATTDVTRPTEWESLIQKEYNFYQVSPFVFRSEQPSKNMMPLLKRHNIDVVINLRASNKDKKVFQDTHTKLVHIPIHTWSMSKEDLLKVMQSIQEAKQSNQKVLIHCYHGSDRTGASIAMYRIIFENWTHEAAINEMKNGGYGFHSIWSNLENLFTPENIQWIQQQLSNPS